MQKKIGFQILSLMIAIAYSDLCPDIILTEQQARQRAAGKLVHLFLHGKEISHVNKWRIKTVGCSRKEKRLTAQNEVP